MIRAVTIALALAIAAPAAASENAFLTIVGHLEAIRQELIKDSTKDVSIHAEAITSAAAELAESPAGVQAGVADADLPAVRELLAEVQQRATNLAEAADLESVREAYAKLTQPMVRWHTLVQGDRPVVVYCPHAKKAWLQPDEEVGNPFLPTTMLRCGSVVAR